MTEAQSYGLSEMNCGVPSDSWTFDTPSGPVVVMTGICAIWPSSGIAAYRNRYVMSPVAPVTLSSWSRVIWPTDASSCSARSVGAASKRTCWVGDAESPVMTASVGIACTLFGLKLLT